MNIEVWQNSQDGPIDIEEALEVELVIREDGKVLWVNTRYGCLVRLCRIKGVITIVDQRKKKRSR